MFRLIIDADNGLLKLILNGSPDAQQLQHIFHRIEDARSKFAKGYAIWIRLPAGVRSAQMEEQRKIDLLVFSGRSRGLKKVVIEVPPDDPTAAKVAAWLSSIYKTLAVPVTTVNDKAAVLRALGLLWKKKQVA